MTGPARISGRDRHVLIIGGVIMLGLISIGKVRPKLREWEAGRVTAAIETSSRARTLAQGIKEQRTRAAVATELRQRQRANDSAVFSARDAGAAAAQLVGLLRDLADTEGLVLHSIQPRIDSSRATSLQVVTARLNLTGDVEGLMDFVTNIETNARLLRITEMSISQADPMSADDRPDVLKIELALQGIARLMRSVK